MTKSRGWNTVGALLVALASCRAPLALEGLTISVAVSSDAVTVGESVTITTIIRNEAWNPVTIAANTCGPTFRVTTVTGIEVPLGYPTACTLMAQPVTIAPGEAFQFVDVWDGRDRSGEQLVGTYQIIGDPFSGYSRQSAPVAIRWLE
jgi:hypothetical protein